jgi:TonB family protein
MPASRRVRTLLCLLPLLPLASPLAGQDQEQAAVIEPARPADATALARELTRRYPVPLERRGVGGTVRVRAFVDTAGSADSVHVITSSGVSRLDGAATGLVRGARFVPARDGSGPVGSWTELALRFGEDVVADTARYPKVSDRAGLEEAAQASFPDDLRRRRIDAGVTVLLEIDSDGVVSRAQAPDPGCFPAAVSAALAVAEGIRFEPDAAGFAGPRRSVATIYFAADTVRLTLLGDRQPAPRPTTPPAATGRGGATRRPELQNLRSVQQALSRRAADLKRIGLHSGEVKVWLFVDERGSVDRRRISESSGACELDLVALEVGTTMRFSPALREGERVSVWVEIPIRF